MIRACVIAFATSTLLACDNTHPRQGAGADANAAPAIELDTPDRALRSYWAVMDWGRAQPIADEEVQREARRVELFNRTVIQDLAREASPRSIYEETFDRDILEVKQETPSRAVITVVVRNTTPIPVGAHATEAELRRRERGDRYRYVMEMVGKEWRVAEIWEVDYGGGWRRKTSRGPKKPDVPILTFFGV